MNMNIICVTDNVGLWNFRYNDCIKTKLFKKNNGDMLARWRGRGHLTYIHSCGTVVFLSVV